MSATCKDCGLVYCGFGGHMVMLKDWLWKKVSKGRIKICLCDRCIEKRLGRPIKSADLISNVLVNQEYMRKHNLT